MKIYFPNVKYYKIYNNFYLIYIKTNSNIFYSEINVNIGSINEDTSQSGLAHFFEHMIFKGTKNKKSEEILEKLDFLGTKYNASTNFENTKYYISGNVRDYMQILEILIDLLLNPDFPETEIANEINVVLEEIRMNSDSNSIRSINKLMKMIYKNTDKKFATPIFGIKTDIKNFTRNNLINFYNDKYLNANKILSIVGSVEENKIIDIVEKMFNTKLTPWKPIFNLLNTHLQIPFYNKKSNFSLSLVETPEINQFNVYIGFRSLNIYSTWGIIADTVCSILTEGMSSRLFVLLRNKLGLSYYQSSFNKSYSNHGVFFINYGVQPEGLEISLLNVLQEILNFGNLEISDNEIKKTKNRLENINLYNTETDIGLTIIDAVINRINPYFIKKFDKNIKKIKKIHIKKLASKIFKKSNMFIVINCSKKINLNKIKKLINDI